ncbi:MAG: glutamine--fructose-6-phosphate transaminase (isomerizing) [Pseudomonadota bacterium]|nr:glutamine--fructose-6-phosphate transaminase (isomerizing) [Pseudomonadota bacterium]
MCGIVGIIGKNDVVPDLVEGLKRLEYRGYDSAGLATIANGKINRRRVEGKISNLSELLLQQPLVGSIGIGHTRWATHGVPNERNAHPHATEKVAVVHNGIIENFQTLKDELEKSGYKLASDTDTEVAAHLITKYLDEGLSKEDATFAALGRFQGAFALGIIFSEEPDLLIAGRRGSPLAIGYGDGEMFIGSDAIALANLSQNITYLEEGDIAVVRGLGVSIRNKEGEEVTRAIHKTTHSKSFADKGGYAHFMLKEIYEQPQVIGDTLHSFINPADNSITLPNLPINLNEISKITIAACGTAFYAGLTAKYWIEKLSGIPVEVDIASEFRYRTTVFDRNGITILISQSGETADTLAVLRHCRNNNQRVLSIVNVPESTIARESNAVLRTYAGPEIGVASTKAFTTQLTVLACLSLVLGRLRGAVDTSTEVKLVEALIELPALAANFLNYNEKIKDIASELSQARDVLFLGRGTNYPIALEGALKLKEISYIHAEGYAAGEMKHGPIALIDDDVPVIIIAPSDPLVEKTFSNMQEVMARGGRVIFIGDDKSISMIDSQPWHKIILPRANPFVVPILYSLPVQLLAYYTAVIKGTDVDKPRNLAKSVTVE